jgi:hypothetical protein
MSTRSQSKPSANASLNEDYSELGLRILGRIIARRLAERHRHRGDKTHSKKVDDSPKTIYEDIP